MLVHRTIEVVPAVIETTRASTETVTNNPNLVNAAIDATVSVITNTIDTKVDRFDADADQVDDLLNSPSFPATTNAVLQATVAPVIEVAAQSENPEEVLTAVTDVVSSIAEQAAEVVSRFNFDENTADVSEVITQFVTETVLTDGASSTETLQNIADGTALSEDVVADTGDVSQEQHDIQNFVQENPELDSEDITDVVQTIPTSTWGDSTWGDFNWG